MVLPDNYPCYEIFHEDDDHVSYNSYPDETATHHHSQQPQPHQQQQLQQQHIIYQQQDDQQHVYHQEQQQQIHQHQQQHQSISQEREKLQHSPTMLNSKNNIGQIEQLRIARQYIDEIIDDSIPYIEKTGYIEAREKAPHLLELETNPLWFLQYEKWNIWNAARRIVKYWEWKRVAFGEDRTFRYIHDLSGNGSLNENDLMIIGTGMASLLPKDQYGSTVLLFNRYHTTDAIDWETLDGTQKLRFTFFWFSRAVQDQYNHNHNDNSHIYFNRNISNSFDDNFDGDDDGVGKLVILYVILSFVKVPSRNFRDMVTEAMPIRIVNTYVIFYPSHLDMFTLSRYIIPSFLKFHAPIIKFASLYPCCCSSSYEVADKILSTNTLYPSSLNKDGIPIELGGKWSFDNFYQWLDHCRGTNHDPYYHNQTNYIQQQQTQQKKTHQYQEQPSMILTLDHRHYIPEQQQQQQQQQQQYTIHHQQQEQVLFHKHDTSMNDEVLLTDLLMIDDHIDDNFHSEIDFDGMMMITPEPVHYTQHIQQKQDTITNLPSLSSTPYWILRHQLFAERSHLSPIDIDGGGTLCQEDLKILQTGCLMILPNTKIGQRVLLYDPSKDFITHATSQQWFNRHRRCFFHCISLLMETEPSSSSTIDSGKRNDTFVDILNLFPNIRIARIHVFLEPVGMGWYSYQENAQIKAIQLFDTTCKNTVNLESADGSINNSNIPECDNNNNDVTNLIEFHTLSSSQNGNDDDGMDTSLGHENHGENAEQLGEALSIMFQFEKQNLPVSLGGTWTYTCFQAWQEKLLPSSYTTKRVKN